MKLYQYNSIMAALMLIVSLQLSHGWKTPYSFTAFFVAGILFGNFLTRALVNAFKDK